MTADPLGRRFNNDVSAMFDRPGDVAASTESVVNDQRDAILVGDVGDLLEVGHGETRITQRLDIERLGVGINGGTEGFRIVAIDELDVDAEARQRDLELIVGAAVEMAAADDVVAGLGDRGDRQELCRLP